MSTTPSLSAAHTGKEQISPIKAQKNTRIAEFEVPLRPKQRERMDKKAKE